MAQKWQIWRDELDKDPEARLLFEQMMYPQTGKESMPSTRYALGPAVELMEPQPYAAFGVRGLAVIVALDRAYWRSVEHRLTPLVWRD